jgi:23S rRNA pseudouridine1911/1915/1917 synthase
VRRQPLTRRDAVTPAAPSEPARLNYSDARLAVVEKPSGLSLATPRSAADEAVERLRSALAPEEAACIDGPLWLVHRLDVGTSGLVALARDADTHRLLVAAFGERRVQKTYLALVWGRPRPREGIYEAALGPDRTDRRRMTVDPEGRAAVTRYRVLEVAAVAPHVSLVELEPATGRTHQIRVHLAAAGHPVVGDDLYGGPRHHGVRDVHVRRRLAPPHTLLHAWKLALPAPPLASALACVAALPPAFAGALEAVGIEFDGAPSSIL